MAISDSSFPSWDTDAEVYDSTRLRDSILAKRATPRSARGLTTGWETLDECFSLRKKQLTVVSGVPNHGKSEFMDALIVNSVRNHNWKWGIFSPENYPYDDHYEKIAEKFAEKPFRDIQPEVLEHIIETNRTNLFWTYPKTPTLGSISDLWHRLVENCGVDALLLDPWNTLEHRRPREQSETEYIGEALGGWIEFARLLDVHIFIVAHPTKIPINRDTNLPYLMNGYDISGSANWVNKPDNLIIVQRPDFNTCVTNVHIQKVRDQRHTGKKGTVAFEYDANHGGIYFEKGGY